MIDTHQHFWRYNPEEYAWIDARMEILQQDFLPETLKPILEQTRFEGTIAVQSRQTLDETQWLLDLANQHDWIKGVIGWVDLCNPNVKQQLDRFTQNKKLVGVRHVVHDEPDYQFLLNEDFLNGVEALYHYDLVYDLLLYPNHLPVAIKFVERYPNQKFVLDHLSKPLIREGVLQPWEENIRELASHKNVYCKISGMVTEAQWNNWTTDQFTPYMDVVIDAFGTRRILIGSDWPVCTVSGTYQDVMSIPLNHIKSFTEEERADMESENAKRVYKIE